MCRASTTVVRRCALARIATAGLNNVLCMLPARDAAEADALPAADRAWLRGWLAFTDAHLDALRHTVPLVGLDEVGRRDRGRTADVWMTCG